MSLYQALDLLLLGADQLNLIGNNAAFGGAAKAVSTDRVSLFS